MAEAKTKPTKQSLNDFIKSLDDPQTRADCLTIARFMEAATGSKPVIWGTSIVGFGARTIKYAGGKEADWPLLAFSPRRQNLTLSAPAGSMTGDPVNRRARSSPGSAPSPAAT